MIGIVGATGAGKSSLISLLCRFYDVQEGSIRIDGIDIRDLPQADRIIVMRHGMIVEEGTHTELLSVQGYYEELYCHSQGLHF